jgi:hypothetical protein
MEKKKSQKTINIFLDSNLLLQGKFFSEINWKDIVVDDEVELVIKIPFIVIKELDNLKYAKKRARKIIARLRKLDKYPYLDDNIKIDISILPPKWEELNDEHKELLVQEENDHNIIAEILLFMKSHPDEEILFITGDYIPFKLSEKLDITSINWLDEKYDTILKKEEIKEKKVKRPDLAVFFYEKNRVEYVIERPTIIEAPKPLSLDDYEEKERMDLFPLLNVKSKEELEIEIEEYNRELLKIYRYSEISFIVFNNGNHPYTNVDILIKTSTEKNFQIKYKRDVDFPEKPKIVRGFTTIPFIPRVPLKEPNMKYYPIEIEESDRNNIWGFGYSINKIKHNDNLILYPIMVWIPENPNTDRISFTISFTQDQPGKIKDQRLNLSILKS